MGRGAIQTTGPSNYGDLNHYLGAGAGANAAFPDVNFCKTPDAICKSAKYPELKWVAGLFYWLKGVQGYKSRSWNYFTELKAYAAGIKDLENDDRFIAAITGIVNCGCHNPPCAVGSVYGSDRCDAVQTIRKIPGLELITESKSNKLKARSEQKCLTEVSIAHNNSNLI